MLHRSFTDHFIDNHSNNNKKTFNTLSWKGITPMPSLFHTDIFLQRLPTSTTLLGITKLSC